MLVRLSAHLLKVPAAQASLVSGGRLCSASSHGPGSWEPLETSICEQVIATGQPLYIEDIREHPLARSAPSILQRGIRACAAEPLRTDAGVAVGVLCAVDFEPHAWTEQDAVLLRDLASSGSSRVELMVERVERQRTEERLREAERVLSTLISSLPGIAYRCLNEPSWPVVFASRGAEEVTGYPAAEFMSGRITFEELIHPEDRGWIWEAVQEALRERRPFRFEYRILTRSGEERWLWEQGEGVFGLDGELVAVEGFCQDVTQRKDAVDALRRSEQQHRLMFEQNPVPMWVFDRETLRILAVNDAAVAQYGWTREEFLGMTIHDVRRPEDAHLLHRHLERRPERLNRTDARHVRKDGSTLEVEITSHVIQYEGRPARVVQITDVTELRQAQDALRSSESLLRQLTENIDEVFWVCTPGFTRILYVSPAYERVWKRSREEAYARPLAVVEAVHPDDQAHVREAIQSRERGRGSVRYRIVHPDGTVRWILDRSFPVHNDRGELERIVGIAEDVTERDAAEAALRASLREKEVLLKEVHHRVKNNLQIVSSLLRLQARSSANAEAGEILLESQARIRSMALLHEMLYAAGDLGRIDMVAYVRRLVQQLIQTYATDAAQVRVEVTGAETLELEPAVAYGLIVGELVSNALQHAFPGATGGRVRVDLRRAATCEALVLRVEDDGVGLPRGDREPQGLGLQLVQMLTDQLGGTLQRFQQGGTQFVITVPIAQRG